MVESAGWVCLDLSMFANRFRGCQLDPDILSMSLIFRFVTFRLEIFADVVERRQMLPSQNITRSFRWEVLASPEIT